MTLPAGTRGAPRRRAVARWRVAGAAVLLAAAGCTAAPAGPAGRGAAASTAAPIVARLLAGVPPAGPTGLELLVSGNPPRLLDVDAGTGRAVAGLPAGPDRVSWVRPVGHDALIVSEAPGAGGGAEVFVLRRGAATATPVGRASDAFPSRDGRGLWLWRYRDEGDCTLREVGLDGRPRRPARRVGCDAAAPGAVAGDLVLSGGDDADLGPLTLTDRRTGDRRRLPRPTRLQGAATGLRSPDRRLLAVEFADPAWQGGPAQLMDVWLLDLRTRHWRRLPGMPVLAALKSTAMAWTGDGRLLLLGSFDQVGDALAVWRPGQDRLAVRRLRLPEDRAGSDSFVPRPAARGR